MSEEQRDDPTYTYPAPSDCEWTAWPPVFGNNPYRTPRTGACSLNTWPLRTAKRTKEFLWRWERRAGIGRGNK